ncbi:MAG: hypothetical protein AB8B58_19910 [Roseobacter sp.]
MSRWRIVMIVGCCCAAALMVFAVIGGATSGPGKGEVSVILHGFFLMIGAWIAGLLILAALMFWMWGNKVVRYVLMVIVLGPVIVTGAGVGYMLVSDYLRQLPAKRERAAWQAARDALEAAVRPISEPYIAQLFAPEFQPSGLPALRAAFTAEMTESGIANWQRTNASYYFVIHADLYGFTFARTPDMALPKSIGGGLLHEAACFEFSERFKAEFTAAQAEVFSGYCSDYKIANGPKALEFFEKRR